jgi:hypothetical protein
LQALDTGSKRRIQNSKPFFLVSLVKYILLENCFALSEAPRQYSRTSGRILVNRGSISPMQTRRYLDELTVDPCSDANATNGDLNFAHSKKVKNPCLEILSHKGAPLEQVLT